MSDVQQYTPTPRSFSWPAASPGKMLPDLPDHLPIWILSFWDRLSDAHDACLSWKKCRDWVNTPRVRSPANRRLIGELDDLRARVCWHGYLAGNRRDRHVDDIFDLLSNSELDSGQVNDLLELIERKLVDTPDSQPTPYFIAPTELAVLILSSHENRMDPTHRKQHLQRLAEEELVQRRRLAVASIAWIPVGSHGHWVAYVVHPITSTIFYGDPLGRRIPANLRDALQWWLYGLRERMEEPVRSPNSRLISVTSQEDNFSCGILSTNSLLHLLLPHDFPLVLRDNISIKMYRIECAIEILELSVELVRTSLNCHMHTLTLEMFQSEGRGVQKFSPTIPCMWPPTPSLPHASSPPSSPIPQQLSPPPPPPSSLPPHPLPTQPLPTHLNSKHERAEGDEVGGQLPSKQQKISQFFPKLTRPEGIEQATRSLTRSVDMREEWVEKQEAEKKLKKTSDKVANTHSQQKCRARKKESEMQSGVRGLDGKIKKVTESINSDDC